MNRAAISRSPAKRNGAADRISAISIPQQLLSTATVLLTDRAVLEAYNGHPAREKVLAFLRPVIDAIEIDFEP
jgi:hypothetical protein